MKSIISFFLAVALPMSISAQNNNTMFIHKGQTIHEHSISEVDSIIFYRTTDQTVPPIVVVNRTDNNPQTDTVFVTDTIFKTDTIFENTDFTAIAITITQQTWETSLGTASFATDSIWIISNGTITQVWSDAVQTRNCSGKTTFNGGSFWGPYLIDCRSNPNQKGDLFSWRAVAEVENICPEGWRVPIQQDFIDLDVAMGGTGGYRDFDLSFINENYLARWGGAYGGRAVSSLGGTISNQESALYWAQSEHNANNGSRLYLRGSDGDVICPQGSENKSDGLSLRCVRDN